MPSVPWYVAARYVALGVFWVGDAFLWRWVRIAPPSRRRGRVVVATLGLVLVVGTLLVDILVPFEGIWTAPAYMGLRYAAIGALVTADVAFWWLAATSPYGLRSPRRLVQVATALMGLVLVAVTLFVTLLVLDIVILP